jgi:hypothetical protein
VLGAIELKQEHPALFEHPQHFLYIRHGDFFGGQVLLLRGWG